MEGIRNAPFCGCFRKQCGSKCKLLATRPLFTKPRVGGGVLCCGVPVQRRRHNPRSRFWTPANLPTQPIFPMNEMTICGPPVPSAPVCHGITYPETRPPMGESKCLSPACTPHCACEHLLKKTSLHKTIFIQAGQKIFLVKKMQKFKRKQKKQKFTK